jgi:hypothetical protein
MDPERMPSENAENARRKAAEVMASLKKGEPGDADKIMGDRKQSKSGGEEQKSSKGFLQKLGLGGKKSAAPDDGVIR